METATGTLTEEKTTGRSIFVDLGGLLFEKYPNIQLTQEAWKILDDFKVALDKDKLVSFKSDKTLERTELIISLVFKIETYPLVGDFALSVCNMLAEIAQESLLVNVGEVKQCSARRVIIELKDVIGEFETEETLNLALENFKKAMGVFDTSIWACKRDIERKCRDYLKFVRV